MRRAWKSLPAFKPKVKQLVFHVSGISNVFQSLLQLSISESTAASIGFIPIRMLELPVSLPIWYLEGLGEEAFFLNERRYIVSASAKNIRGT